MTETVLYVDDDTANLVVLKATCQDEFDVITASSGPEGLDILKEREVAVLLVDQRMPGMNGVEVFEIAQQLYPDTIRILITAYSDLTDAISAINRGQIRRYIRKPWDPEELKAVLREAIDTYQIRRKIVQLETRLIETERTYALGVVAASVAHELRNPLAAMVMGLDLAQLRLDQLVGELRRGDSVEQSHVEAVRKVRHQLDEIAKATDQVSEITKGMELGHRRRDEDVQADLGEIVELTLTFVRAALLKRAQLEVETTACPPVKGSPNKLSQVMTNLLVNAMQALPDRPRSDNRISVTLTTDATGRWVRLAVADNGEGIPDSVRGHIFDPFFTTKTQGGTGLGLAISKRIVEEVGGHIEVESQPGSGTTFVVELPAASATARGD
jgi:two-component system sensor histidine kinase/response regulator